MISTNHQLSVMNQKEGKEQSSTACINESEDLNMPENNGHEAEENQDDQQDEQHSTKSGKVDLCLK